MSVQKTDTIFITGTGRSGTNILKKVLAQHRDMASLPFEYRFIIDPGGVLDFYNSYPAAWSPYRADHQIKNLEHYLLSLAAIRPEKQAATEKTKAKIASGVSLTPPPYAGWELEKWIPGYTGFVRTFIASLTSFSYNASWPGTPGGIIDNQMYFAPPRTKLELRPMVAAFLQQCADAIRQAQGKSLFQEDNTHNLLFANDLLDLFANGRMLHIVRDPRDVLGSLMQQRWAPKEVDQLIAWYEGVMGQWLAARDGLPQERILEIRLEDFTAKPEATLRAICDFAGIDFDPAMLKVELNEHNSGRYKTDFTATQIKSIDGRLDRFMKHYNYA